MPIYEYECLFVCGRNHYIYDEFNIGADLPDAFRKKRGGSSYKKIRIPKRKFVRIVKSDFALKNGDLQGINHHLSF